MKVLLPFFLLFFIFIASSTQNSLYLGNGFVDRLDDQVTQCANFSVPLPFKENRLGFKEICLKSRRPQRAIHVPIIFAVAFVAGFIPSALGSLILQSNLKTSLDGLKSDLADLKKTRKLNAEGMETIRKAQEVMTRQLSDEEWQAFEDSFFERSNIEKVFKFLKIDPEQLLRKFQIPQSLGTDIFRTFTYETQCGTNFDTVELNVCYHSSRTRKVGGVLKLAPRGKFIHGTTYRYWETPNYGIITNDGLVSADRCKRIGGMYACEQSSANCTYYETTGCILRTIETDGTFVKEIDDSSFVATVLKKYTVFNDTGSVTKIVGESGQLFLNMPNKYQAIFGNHVINGRHQTFQEVDIIVEERIPSMNHNEINKFVKDQIKADFLISEQRVKELHGTVPWSFNADNISYWVFENVGVILVVIGVLALLLFVYYCGPYVWVLQRKLKNKEDSIPKRNEFLEC